MVVIIVLVAFVILIYRFQDELKKAYAATGRATAPIRSAILPFPDHYREILIKYFPYYSRLDAADQHRFEQKLLYFILSKQFIPRQFGRITDEMKVMIAACAVQLTFGLPRVYLQHFDKILVYPDDYYSSITKRFHKGEVNPAFGVIVLSWRSFVDGYIDHTDSINLGLHEMAHALRLENIVHNDEHDFFDDALVKRLDAIAAQICNVQQDNSFLRAYACSDPHEFFAVAVENFFERPAEFKSHMPELYSILSELLRQDPINLLS
jgi:Mlc titration factor MtfA (ptsG expression regulator)